MVDVKEIREMKELGVTKRKTEVESWEYEYTFKVPCKVCGEKVEWCFCAETLEDVKKVLAAKMHTCLGCYRKPENMMEHDRERVEEIMKEAQAAGYPLTRNEAFQELQQEWADGYDGDPHELDDGTEYVDCDCPI